MMRGILRSSLTFIHQFATLYIPQFGVVDSYKGNAKELDSALGIYLASWFIVSVSRLYATALC